MPAFSPDTCCALASPSHSSRVRVLPKRLRHTFSFWMVLGAVDSAVCPSRSSHLNRLPANENRCTLGTFLGSALPSEFTWPCTPAVVWDRQRVDKRHFTYVQRSLWGVSLMLPPQVYHITVEKHFAAPPKIGVCC